LSTTIEKVEEKEMPLLNQLSRNKSDSLRIRFEEPEETKEEVDSEIRLPIKSSFSFILQPK